MKQANKRFNTTGHDYEITIRNDSEVLNFHFSSKLLTTTKTAIKSAPRNWLRSSKLVIK